MCHAAKTSTFSVLLKPQSCTLAFARPGAATVHHLVNLETPHADSRTHVHTHWETTSENRPKRRINQTRPIWFYSASKIMQLTPMQLTLCGLTTPCIPWELLQSVQQSSPAIIGQRHAASYGHHLQ